MTVIDVHTHMLDRSWLELLRREAPPRYEVAPVTEDLEGIYRDGALFMTPMPGHFDYGLRVRDMDAAGVDLAIVSLTCPNVYWGGEAVSLQAARIMNDSMARGQAEHPARIRWMASLPWEYPDQALGELERACKAGAVGVMVLANVAGRPLTEPAFAPIGSREPEREPVHLRRLGARRSVEASLLAALVDRAPRPQGIRTAVHRQRPYHARWWP